MIIVSYIEYRPQVCSAIGDCDERLNATAQNKWSDPRSKIPRIKSQKLSPKTSHTQNLGKWRTSLKREVVMAHIGALRQILTRGAGGRVFWSDAKLVFSMVNSSQRTRSGRTVNAPARLRDEEELSQSQPVPSVRARTRREAAGGVQGDVSGVFCSKSTQEARTCTLKLRLKANLRQCNL